MTAILPGQKTNKGSNEPFTFTTSVIGDDGEPVVITVPSLAKVKLNEYKLQLLREESPVKAIGYSIRCTLGTGEEANQLMLLLAELDPDESTRFTEEWQAHSGVSQGESKAS